MRTHDAPHGATASRAVAARRAGVALLAVAVLLAAGCAGSIAPAPAWLPVRHAIANFPYGAFADVEGRDAPKNVLGELIAVESESTYVLTEGQGLVALPTRRITRIAVRTFRPPGGLFIVNAGPLSRGVEGVRMKELRSRARFPQGLPPELDRSTLRLPGATP